MRKLRYKLDKTTKALWWVSGKGRIWIQTAWILSQCSQSLCCACGTHWDQSLAQSQPTLPVSYYYKLAKSMWGIALIIHFDHNTDCTDWQIAPCSSASKATPKLLGGTRDFSNSLNPQSASHQLQSTVVVHIQQHFTSSPLHQSWSSLNHFSPTPVQYVLEESVSSWPFLIPPTPHHQEHLSKLEIWLKSLSCLKSFRDSPVASRNLPN